MGCTRGCGAGMLSLAPLTWLCVWLDFQGFAGSQLVMSSALSLGKLYGDLDYLEERHRHRFEVRKWDLWFVSSLFLRKCDE